MTLNVDRHKDAIVGAWRQVMDEKDPVNWALFGYEGLSYDLNLVSKGDGGLEELAEDLNSGKIMYALCRVKLKEKNVEKVILVNWQGEGAPLSRKGTCANHIGEVKSFFKGVHVTINARTDEDVDPDVIMQTVTKAVAGEGVKTSGSADIETQAPVGTVYKKVNPKDDINSVAKEEFWRKEEQEEERRKREEQNKYRKFSQNEVKLLRRESQEYFNEAEKTPSPKTNGSNKPNNSYMSTAEAVKASMPKRDSNAGDLVRQRIKSFDHGVSPSAANGNSNGTSDNTNGGSANGGETISVLKRRQLFEGGAMNSTSTAPMPRRNPAQEIKQAQENAKKATSNGTPQPAFVQTPPKVQTVTVTDSRPAETKAYSPTPPIVQETVKSVSPTPKPVEAYIEPKLVEPEPVEKYVEPKVEPYVEPKPVEKYVESKPVHHYDEPAHDEPTNGNYDYEPTPVRKEVNGGKGIYEAEVAAPIERHDTGTPTFEITPDMGACARALYDYQAADDSEISFDPGEIITNIEQIDEGWWEGMGPRGIYGLFPANYVELIN